MIIMNIGEIFKDSLKYPFTDSKQFITLAILFLLGNLGNLFINFNIADSNMILIFEVIAIITSIIAGGYLLNIIRNVSNSIIPKLNVQKDFVNGIRLVVLGIVFFIIPIVITIVVAQLTGFFADFSNLLDFSLNNPSSTAPEAISNSLAQSTIITAIVSLIVFFIFSIFYAAAVGRLASTNSLKEALSFKNISSDILNIGWGKYIEWVIVNLIIIFILSIIFSFVMSAIFYVGYSVWSFLFETYLSIYSARSLGLIYSNS